MAEEAEPPEIKQDMFRYHSGETYEGGFITITPELQEGEEEAQPPYIVRHDAGKIEVSADGYTYEGGFDKELFHGEGALVLKSGARYSGGWDHGKYHGKGKYTWPDGSSYDGDWVQNVMHGHGVYLDVKGDSHEGQFYNGVGPGFTG
mmetsp:Transcript_7069/g.8132  ORF Transcript_7069/g.8132 Transcript_7069/m.8132 type:complete len:147 (-) Transcript_7069:573-1013(-)|eukprot:CAMPEP_0197849870 /NCGR_PEP_ID=MMETSP1438-20131217/13506_1 /TAXON_ID=1461541 /ORGANISM="Pterosperma sp., Strain CCMP1384" /LENGTH=146 /DNA_ID=CAMNT_0043462749 /DNA_START=128 /DNA_END=568 /DNA_ORIENTATION=+